MQALLNALDGKSDDILSPGDIVNFVSEISRQTTYKDRARYNFYLTQAITREKIEPNTLLPIAISRVSGVNDTIPVAIALRYGANRNMYVNTPKVGSAHIMLYTVSTMRDKGCDNNIIIFTLLILQIMGCNVNVNAFDLSGGKVSEFAGPAKVKDVDTEIIEAVASNMMPAGFANIKTKTPDLAYTSRSFESIHMNRKAPSMSVKEWLAEQGLPKFDDVENSLKTYTQNIRGIIGAITDRTDLAYPDSYIAGQKTMSPTKTVTLSPSMVSKEDISNSDMGILLPNLEMVLSARSTEVLKRYPLNEHMTAAKLEKGSYIALMQCIDAYSLDGFMHFMNKGLMPTYFTMNTLVLSLRDAIRTNNISTTNMYQQMIIESVARGIRLDIEQLSVVSVSSDSLAQAILQVYRQPAWQKVCAAPLDAGSDQLKTLAFTLNMTEGQSKQATCVKLREFSEANPSSLKTAARLRQQVRVGASMSSINDFMSGSSPTVTCKNKTVLQRDPFSYNDASMSFYTDKEGSVWCFTSDMYENLLANPINPHKPGKDPLPEDFVQKLKIHLDILKRLGISVSNPETYDDAIDSLTKPEEVTSKESDFIVSTILDAAKVTGSDPERIKKMTFQQMNDALNGINMTQLNLQDMTIGHRLITFCRAAYTMIKAQPSTSKAFYTYISTLPA